MARRAARHRDRLPRPRPLDFAGGATLGAPQALQVAVRWHLWRNPRPAFDRAYPLAEAPDDYRALDDRSALAMRITF